LLSKQAKQKNGATTFGIMTLHSPTEYNYHNQMLNISDIEFKHKISLSNEMVAYIIKMISIFGALKVFVLNHRLPLKFLIKSGTNFGYFALTVSV
jgi:hypothetical protein